MLLGHAVARFDTLYPNALAYAEKLKWISDLDGMIFRDIHQAFENCGAAEFSGYDIRTDKNTVLLVPPPDDDIYIKYLSAQNDLVNGDSTRYQNSQAVFNTAYSDYAAAFTRSHMPKGEKIRL